MNCNDINKTLVEGAIALPLTPEAQDHLKNCERCREFVAAVSKPASEASPSPAILRQIEKGLLADLRPIRPIAAKPYFLASLIAIFLCFVALGVYRIGAFALAVMSPLQAAVILGALAISAALLAYSLVNQIVPGSLHWLTPAFLPVGITISLAITTVVLFQFQHERNFWINSWACIRTGVPIGALATIPLWFVLRRGAILSPSVTGLATGLFAGLVGTTALEIHCPILDAWHILLSHLGVALLGAMAGLFLGLAAEKGQMMWRRP
jgi:hypothetical protein